MRNVIRAGLALAAVSTLGGAVGAHAVEPKSVAGVICDNPPRINCPQANCAPELSGYQGDVVETKSGRKFFLEYPCNLKPGEKLIFILSIHGAGSVGNWQRHYFPATDLKEKYRLVIATPTAAAAMPGRTWQAQADDKFLEDLSTQVIKAFGQNNIKAFWLVGHSQGGITSRRIVCSPYFRDKVDGFLSLSGGRVGSPAGYQRTGMAQGAPGAPPAAGRGGATPAAGRGGATPAPGAAAGRGGATPPAAGAGRGGAGPAAGRGAAPAAPADNCDYSFIYSQGELEGSIAPASTWAEKYGCGARRTEADIVDDKAGYVTATDQTRGPGWGRFARPGVAKVWTFPGCKGGKVVADVNRIDKGHTEGYEPKILDRILGLIASAPGGKLRTAKL